MNQTPRQILDTILGHLGFVATIEEQVSEGHLILQIGETDRPEISDSGKPPVPDQPHLVFPKQRSTTCHYRCGTPP